MNDFQVDTSSLFVKNKFMRHAATYMTLFALALVGIFLVKEVNVVRSVSLFGLSFRRKNNVTNIGHRGTRGLMPENTIPAFLYGITLGAQVIEMDVYLTADNQVVVAHDPSLNAVFCRGPNGETIPNTDFSVKHFLMKNMNMSDIAKCDCGKPNKAFPTQTPFPIAPPLLTEMFDAVETFVKQNNKSSIYYLIEIKTNPSWDVSITPPFDVVAQKVYDVIKAKGMMTKTIIQDFDVRPLQYIHNIDKNVRLGLLTGTDGSDYAGKLKQLGFIPYSYGPTFTVITSDMLSYMHERHVQVFGWSVNEFTDIQKLMDMGIDGIITDYPDRVEKLKNM